MTWETMLNLLSQIIASFFIWCNTVLNGLLSNKIVIMFLFFIIFGIVIDFMFKILVGLKNNFSKKKNIDM